MTALYDKQHRRVLILTAAVIYLVAITVWQNGATFLQWQPNAQFSPGSSVFIFAAAIFSNMVATGNVFPFPRVAKAV